MHTGVEELNSATTLDLIIAGLREGGKEASFYPFARSCVPASLPTGTTMALMNAKKKTVYVGK